MSIYGQAGASLQGATFTKNTATATIGQVGEKKMADLINPYCQRPGGPAVFHDIDVPGKTINIDHLLITGNRVIPIDSKVWQPNWYITIFGHTIRGTRLAPWADKKTYLMIDEALRPIVEAAGGKLKPSLVVVFPSRPGPLHLGLYKPKGARALDQQRFVRKYLSANMPGANPHLEAAIARWVGIG